LVTERKTEVGCVVLIKQIVWICVKMNNASPKRSLCHVPYLNEMTMKYFCYGSYKKYNENMHV
jgi:hypothetical protein